MNEAEYDSQCRECLLQQGFELVKILDRGAFGVVWEAHQLIGPARQQPVMPRNLRLDGSTPHGLTPPELSMTPGDSKQPTLNDLHFESGSVAIKIIDEAPRLERFARNPGNASNPTAQSVFLMQYRRSVRREVANFMKLRGNPNIVSVITSGSFPSPLLPRQCECHFIAMELMHDSLRSLMRTPLKIIDRVRLALDAVRATRYAHSQQVAHRDIKPENLLIANSAQLAIKMGDFGIAVDYDVSEIRPDAVLAGTMPYIAPELFYMSAAQGGDISEKIIEHMVGELAWIQADIYSLGVTLYELFMQTLPYSMYDSFEKRARILRNCDFPRLVRNKDVPMVVAETIEGMINVNPKERTNLDKACILLEGAVGECHVGSGTDTDPGLNHKVTRLVRNSLRWKIDSIVRAISPELCPPSTVSDLNSDWYLNVLLRPARKSSADKTTMLDYLCPVYGAHFVRSTLEHWDHWDQSRDLVRKKVSISDSCCGLPIQMMTKQDASALIAQGLLFSRNVDVRRYKDPITGERRDDVVSFVRIMNVLTERFGKDANPVISKIYKTDVDHHHHIHGPLRGNGWTYRPVGDENGAIHQMSQNIQTEIIVPIYAPNRRRHERRPEDICGVINIEWVWAPGPEELGKIETHLVNAIHRDKLFPISEFLSEIVSIATTLDY